VFRIVYPGRTKKRGGKSAEHETNDYRILLLYGRDVSYSPSAMQPAHLDLEKQSGTNGSQTVMRLNGKLSLETVPNFIQTLRPEAAAHLVLDLGGVSFLDSAGVGALVQLFVHRRSKGQAFALTGLTKQGSAVLQVSGLTKLLPIHASLEEALAQHA
jgi:anti-sigma B factor antagonist